MANAAVLQSTTTEENDYINQAAAANLSQLSAKINYSKRRIIILQMELADWKSAELGVLQKMNYQSRKEYLELNRSSDKFISTDPLKGTKPATQGTIDPDARISQTRNKILGTYEDYAKQQTDIGDEILKVSRQIQIERMTLDNCQKRLKTLGSDVQIYMDKDAITKRSYTEIYMLFEIHSKYAELTVGSDGSRKYTNDEQTLIQLQRLTQKFNALGTRNSFVVDGVIKLDFSDPGSKANGAILTQLLEQLRQVMNVDTAKGLDSDLKKYSDQMTSNLNDPWISKQLLRQVETGREPQTADQLRAQTVSPTKVVSFVNKQVDWANKKLGPIQINYDFASQSDSVKSWFGLKTSKNYNNIPFCDPQKPTPTDSTMAARQVAEVASEKAAGVKFNDDFNKTKVKSNTNLLTIPNFGFNLRSIINNKTSVETLTSLILVVRPVLVDQNISDAYEYGPSRTEYETKIISEAQNLYDSLAKYLQEGYTTTYDYYVKQLIALLDSVNPPLLKSKYS